MLEEALPALDLKLYLNFWSRRSRCGGSRAKGELWTWEDYAAAADRMRLAANAEDAVIAAEKAREIALVYEHYQEHLIAEEAVDYGDLIMRPTLMMRADSDSRTGQR